MYTQYTKIEDGLCNIFCAEGKTKNPNPTGAGLGLEFQGSKLDLRHLGGLKALGSLLDFEFHVVILFE